MGANLQVKTQRAAYIEGYKAALTDILAKLDEGGEAEAREWIANNS